jgi:hypothetical protein
MAADCEIGKYNLGLIDVIKLPLKWAAGVTPAQSEETVTISTAISVTAKPAADTLATVYGPAPEGLRARVNISAVNQDDEADSLVFVAISQNSDPSDPSADWIEYGRTLGAGGSGFERTDKWLKPGDYVVARSNTGSVAFRVDGLQEDDV